MPPGKETEGMTLWFSKNTCQTKSQLTPWMPIVGQVYPTSIHYYYPWAKSISDALLLSLLQFLLLVIYIFVTTI